ncbi:MAG: Gfo/Idh/MocA family oxidoreductase [Kouleothrix sp.]|nr:Gfo/Idh/MocA family oxidoreductase [Kouleothrix sp.]
MTLKPVKMAVVGCGNISSIYLQNCPTWPLLDVVACADLDMQRAASQAAKFNIPRAMAVDAVLADPEVELILNLTIPAAHSTVGLAALRAGKSVYNEKPLAIGRADARLMLDEARARGLRVGCAPDTFLGGGLQTCRQLIDAGGIGQPVAAMGQMLSRGPDHWHPDPAFLFKEGAGPLFDMGPYYLTALIALFGPIRRVTGSARITFPERTIRSEPKRGETIAVEAPTHIASVLDFASGPIATLVTSFDVWDQYLPSIEIYGSGGTLGVPDPNTFGGPVRLRDAGAETGREVAIAHGHTENSRGIGVADLAYAIRTGRPQRASGDMAWHVLDTMHAILEASATGRHVELTSTCDRPAPLPAGLPVGQLDT